MYVLLYQPYTCLSERQITDFPAKMENWLHPLLHKQWNVFFQADHINSHTLLLSSYHQQQLLLFKHDCILGTMQRALFTFQSWLSFAR